MLPGQTQAILKYADQRADEGFDEDGSRQGLPARRVDRTAELFVEHGLTPSLTLQAKLAYESGHDAFVAYDGRGLIEVGLRWGLFAHGRTAISLYGGHVFGGVGRNAGYAAPGQGSGDWELRLLAGRSGVLSRRFGSRTVFAEVQAARLSRAGLPDEVRVDLTSGMDITSRWSVLAQTFSGRTDGGGAYWINSETSLVYRRGPWSLQGGWRQAIGGREVPASSGPVVAVWRRF